MIKQKENGKDSETKGEKMIQVGNTGLYFDDGHKGCLNIYLESGKVFSHLPHLGRYIMIEGDNVDSSCEVFKAISKNAKVYGNVKTFLKNHEWLIKECLKEQNKYQKRMVQCWECGLHPQLNNIEIDDEGVEHCCCPPLLIPADWRVRYVDEIPECDHYVLSIGAPITHLKDLDLRSGYIYGLHMICKIKSIKNPTVRNSKYRQECSFYDDNTSKVIKGILEDGVAEYDRWSVGDTVEAWGIFEGGSFTVTSMDLIEEKEPEVIITNRNDETPGYNDWRKSIINRDKKCVCCGLDKHLEAHHLFGYKENPSLAVNESNGVTLCKFCHDKYHSVYGLKNINPVDFMNFIKKYGAR